ncbi:MAG: signal peptidase I [Elusimicrobia bacterium]|jgi:signal peptidase I|nr:signal peptidase I [Elusimicrobiota bacterium]
MEIKLLYITVAIIILKYVSGWGVKKYKKGFLKKFFTELKEWMNAGLWAVVIALFVMSFIVQAFKIPSGSMEDTLLIGDHLFVNKFIYGLRIPFNKEKRFLTFKKPKRKDIVVFEYPKDPSIDYIKRCIGLPGETVLIKDKEVYINGEKLDEPYVYHKDPNIYPDEPYISDSRRRRDNFGPVIIPDGEYFMMGDNRDFSSDSRFWGPLPWKYVKGEALLNYWPPSRIGILK